MTDTYTRPNGCKASALGERNRSAWTRRLRKKLFALTKPIKFLAAEEGATNSARKNPGDDRPRWVSIGIRIDHMAVIEMLKARHLKATGKEISRAEVLAALMASGLEPVLNHQSFGGNDN